MFDSDILSNEPGRIAVVVESVLPILAISFFGYLWNPGSSAGDSVKSRPPARAFAVIWVIVTLCWLMALLVAAFNFDVAGLITFAIFSLLVLSTCIVWLWAYHKKHFRAASLVLILTTLLSFILMLIAACSPNSQDAYAPMTVTCLMAPLGIWVLFATIIGMLELQNK